MRMRQERRPGMILLLMGNPVQSCFLSVLACVFSECVFSTLILKWHYCNHQRERMKKKKSLKRKRKTQDRPVQVSTEDGVTEREWWWRAKVEANGCARNKKRAKFREEDVWARLDRFPHGRVGIGALGESRLLSTTSWALPSSYLWALTVFITGRVTWRWRRSWLWISCPT